MHRQFDLLFNIPPVIQHYNIGRSKLQPDYVAVLLGPLVEAA